MKLMTIDQIRGHIETALGDDELRDLANAAEADIEKRAGVLTITDDEVEAVVETVHAYGRSFLRLGQPIDTVESVMDVTGATDLELVVEDDFEIVGDCLRRAPGYKWGHTTIVEYTPVNGLAVRRRALVALVKLAINDEPGVGSETAGPWNRSSLGKRQDNERERILDTVRELDVFA